MAEADKSFTRIDKPDGIARCLDDLMRHHGASLLLSKAGGISLPVIVVKVDPGESLQIDVSSVRDAGVELAQGLEFQLLGQEAGRVERSAVLQLGECWDDNGVMYCSCPYPQWFEVLHRRDNYRAEIRLGLHCEALVDGGEEHGVWDGALCNLSMTGCLIELPLGAATMLASVEGAYQLKLQFPNGVSFSIEANLCHERSDIERRFLQAGFEFRAPTPAQDRELWYFVCEIEREGARHAAADASVLAPSALFIKSETAKSRAPRRKGGEYPTPMARNLAFIAEFLDTQILRLRSGENIDSVQLSRHAERLLALLEQGREELLFATVCLWHEVAVVRHCLAVAVRLVDIAGRTMPRDLRKAMVASAMVHDLGKVLLPNSVLQSPSFTAEQRRHLHTHVGVLLPRLKESRWLASEVMEPVVEQANERLDGSGYPYGLQAEDLHQLARLVAVVDAVDAMGRNRHDRKALDIQAIYRHLLSSPDKFDARWVKSYIRHFGKVPIGTLVRYRDGRLAWVQELDRHGRPSLVQLSAELDVPRASALGSKLQGEALHALGEPIEILAAEF